MSTAGVILGPSSHQLNGPSTMKFLTDLDWSWIFWQAIVPLLAPVIAWFLACAFKAAFKNTPSFRRYLATGANALEGHGWLVYAVFISLQSAQVISSAKTHPTWIFWFNLLVLLGSFAILCVAFVMRFDETKTPIQMKSAAEVPIQREAAGGVALAAAVVGYLTMSSGRIL